jgi:hypothetical protein
LRIIAFSECEKKLKKKELLHSRVKNVAVQLDDQHFRELHEAARLDCAANLAT